MKSSLRVLILPQEFTFRILTGKQHYHNFPKVWDRQNETYTEATKTKTTSFGGNTEHDIDGRKMFTLQHLTKATMPNTSLGQKNHYLP